MNQARLVMSKTNKWSISRYRTKTYQNVEAQDQMASLVNATKHLKRI